MSTWGSGYVTDIAYTPGWYRQQSPSIMSLACLLGCVASPMPAADDAVHYLELGCGYGYTAMLLAACNPAWRVTAVDYHPTHIAAARDCAAEAGLTNVTFIEGDLTTLADDAAGRQIPEADFVSMHGVWSWVPETVKAGIVRLLRDKVRPGGAVHVSYNALPAWSSALGMARLLRTVGRQRAARSDRQAEDGFKFLRELAAADAMHLKRSHIAKVLMEKLDELPITYLAHEYMNEHWAPCYMADVAEALGGAKLEWVASANLIENFSELTLTEDSTGADAPVRRSAAAGADQGPLHRTAAAARRLRAGRSADFAVSAGRRADGSVAQPQRAGEGSAAGGGDARRTGGVEPQILSSDC